MVAKQKPKARTLLLVLSLVATIIPHHTTPHHTSTAAQQHSTAHTMYNRYGEINEML